MIRAATIARVNPGAWLAVPMILLAVLYVAAYSRTRDPYVVGLTAYSTTPLGFIVPICAALGAWEGGRLRRAGWWDQPHVRSRLAIALVHVAPIIVAGTIAIIAGVLFTLLRVGLVAPDPRPIAVSAAVIAGHTLGGFALGIRLPAALGATAALLASFVWMVFVRAIEPLWLNHLTGVSIALCCGVHEDVASEVVLAAVLVATAIGAAALVWITSEQPSQARLGGGIVVVLAGIVAGSFLVSGFSTYPVAPRDQSALRCTEPVTQPVVCVWQEHAPRLNEIASIARRAATGWRDAGVQLPSTFSEIDPSRADADTLTFRVSLETPPALVLNDFARAMVPPWPACADVRPYPGSEAIDYVQAWYAASAGMDRRDLLNLYADYGATGAPPVMAVIDELLNRPLAVQRSWLEHNEAAVRDCSLEPDLTPVS